MFDNDQKNILRQYMMIHEKVKNAPVAPDETEVAEPDIMPDIGEPEKKPRRSPFRPPRPEIDPEPQNVYLMEDYEDEAHPSTVEWFRSKPLQEHPLLTKHGSNLAKGAFNFTKQRLQNLNAGDAKDAAYYLNIFREIMRIESAHKQELNEMAKDIVSELYGIDKNQLEIEDKVKPNETESQTEWSERGAKIDDRVKKHIHMRATMNMLSHGAAVHQMMTLHHMVKDALDKIDPNLVRLYDQFSAGSMHNYWFWNIRQMAEMLKGSAVGSTKVEYKEENGEEVPVVKAAAMCFPVLVQELSKGVMQMLSHHHIGKLDRATLQRVLSEADKLELEPFFIMVGPELWRKTLQISQSLNLPMAEMISAIASHEPDEVHDLFDKIQSNPNTAQNIIKNWHSELYGEE
jgi:hypothetical protein